MRLGVAVLLCGLSMTMSGCAAGVPVLIGAATHRSPTPSPSATPSPEPVTFTVNGTVSVPSVDDIYTYDYDEPGRPCKSSDGYDDIEPGAQVTLTNASGAKVGIGNLGTGSSDDRDKATGSYDYCSYAWIITGVPDAPGLYSIHIGNAPRGEITYDRSDLIGIVELTIGD